MTDTIREKIIKAVGTELLKITTANGYSVNLGGSSIFRAGKYIDPSSLPAVNVIPQSETCTVLYNKNNCEMVLIVELLADYGTSNPSVVQELLLGDLKKCLLAMTTTSVVIDDINYAGGGPKDQPNPEDTVTAAYVELIFKYKETIGDPYSQ